MKKFKPILFLLFYLLSMSTPVLAQDIATATIEQLEQEMYRLYPTRNVDEFMDVTERLKEASLKVGDEGLFYRTWSNQATFIFSKIDRQKGMEIAKAMNDYSQQLDSKLGIYYSSLTNASHLSSLRMEEDALQLYLKAIRYKQQYLPSVNAAGAYLGAAKIYYNFRQKEKILEMTDKALTEPDSKGAHIVDSWGWRCLAAMIPEGADHKEEMNLAYEEWKKAKEKYKYNSISSDIIEIYHAQVNGDYEKMLEYAKEVKTPQDKYNFMSHAYGWLGQWENALNCYKEYKRVSDSINSAEIRRQASEHSMQLDIIRAENKAKELALHNQSLQLAHVQDELKQQRLEEEALSLTLKNRDIELANAAIQLENDSLDHEAEEMKIREYQSKMEAQEQKEHAHHILIFAVGIIALLIILFLSFFLYRRRLQMLKLKKAYDQLEDVTAAKERIESELRIARDIQMNMLPQRFPQRSDIDIFGSMRAAKEVGGDLYDFFFQDEKLFFCVGDVSGKGVPAALFMANAISLFRTVAKEGISPASIANRLNETLGLNNENGMFVTMFIGIVDLVSGHLDFCNAGHTPPIIIADGQSRYMEMESNAPIGLWPELEFIDEHIDSVMGQVLVIYTDGVNEAENNDMAQFGDDRLLELLNKKENHTAKQFIDRILEDVALHVGNAEPSDDLTLLCLKIIGNKETM